MNLEKRLAKHRATIISQWFELVVNTYPPDTAAFLKRQKDPFHNPVGRHTREGLGGVLDQLLGEMDPKVIRSHLDPIIRIRAVQQFSPSKAIGFILFLKQIVHTIIDKHEAGRSRDRSEIRAMRKFEARVDEVGLIAFDLYMQCREKIYHLKANVERGTIYKAFHRAGLVAQDPENAPEKKGA